MKRFFCILLAVVMLCSCFVQAEGQNRWGDLTGDGQVAAADALRALQHVVNKVTLSEEALLAGDVNADSQVNAQDALLILQYAVRKITRFPAEVDEMDPKEKYYYQLDEYYGVTGADFEEITTDGSAADLVKKLGEVPGDSDINGHKLNSEGNIIYDRISQEAKKDGSITMYNTAETVKGNFVLADGTSFTYEVPTDVTAYTAVPLKYTLLGGANAKHVQVEATTWEDIDRVPDSEMYYENTMPGNVNIQVEYKGYVQAENADGSKSPYWNADPEKDVMGSQYPAYTPSELTYSGTVPSGKETWMKFTFTNTGNTVLKGDGQGTFNLRPYLEKEENGFYTQVAINDNYAYRLYDPLYPGESRDIWVKFAGYASYPVGNYRIVLQGEVANEQGSPNWAAMYVGGRPLTVATFDFSVAQNAGVTTPKQVENGYVSSGYGEDVPVVRNSWLGVYEEFQTSYHTHWAVDTAKPEKETLYFQPAPWDKTLTLRVISEDTGAAKLVTIPLNVESDSISIALNPYNEHYVVKADGTREPMLSTQNMADMRGNNQDSPYPMDVLVNDLKDMKEAGVNHMTSTMAFTYTTGTGSFANTANRAMMDLVSLLGIRFEGYGSYPFDQSIGKASIARGFAGVGASLGNNKINGILNNWVYTRFGDTFWSNADGVTPIAQEDSRGWLTIDHDWRMDLDDDNVAKFQKWLEKAYGTIEKLNAAYDSEYTAFSGVDPREDGNLDSSGHYDFSLAIPGVHVFYEESKAMKDLDLFRTVNRVEDYEESLLVTDVPGAKMIARYESSPLITVGLKATTKNAHYRETYYQMYRAGLVGEILADSDVIYGTSTYINTPYTPSETYELTKHAVRNGIHIQNYHMGYREQIYNTYYGDGKAVENLHLANGEMKVTAINTASALFPSFKATYEAGGMPGVMWMDYYCNGFVTSTKYKELQFYTAKIREMLATDEGKAWATDFDPAGSTVNADAGHVFSYPAEYLMNAYEATPRWDKFNLGK